MANHPYADLPSEAFWKSAVASRSLFDISGLWKPKYEIAEQDAIASFGSCFAQHLGRNLRDHGFNWLITEHAPRDLAPENRKRFNYELFSARTGNIYTTSLLLQWTSWALGKSMPPGEIWRSGDRVLDPFRPRIEPDGFTTAAEMLASRRVALEAFAAAIRRSTIFVFTLGLTESWFHRDGYEYPICPGTAGGDFDANCHRFVNQRFSEVLERLRQAIGLMRQVNPALKILLTVSPVPLTATNSQQHVMIATSRSKSVLRAVAAELAETDPSIDYFPSFEIISSPPMRGAFFEPNMRSVAEQGVAFVMREFFSSVRPGGRPSVQASTEQTGDESSARSELVCEEQLLGAFGDVR